MEKSGEIEGRIGCMEEECNSVKLENGYKGRIEQLEIHTKLGQECEFNALCTKGMIDVRIIIC
jgi:hypothetical protein